MVSKKRQLKNLTNELNKFEFINAAHKWQQDLGSGTSNL